MAYLCDDGMTTIFSDKVGDTSCCRLVQRVSAYQKRFNDLSYHLDTRVHTDETRYFGLVVGHWNKSLGS
jgi:hypothetical protein